MQIETTETTNHARYAKAVSSSKRARWDIDRDVLQGRVLDITAKFLPDSLSLVQTLPSLTDGERRFMSQVQGRTYANIFGLVERFINAKVLALTCLIELFTQVHYVDSIAPDAELSPLYKDVFRFHWMEESQHAILDELEWLEEDAKLDDAARAKAVTDLIDLVGAVDGILQAQSALDADYFIANAGRTFTAEAVTQIRATFLRAYRTQYIASGVERTRFPAILKALIPAPELDRVLQALAPLLAVGAH
jgi:hypothetical protein